MKHILLIFIILITFCANGQNEIRIYKIESKTFEINNKYAIQEIIIRSDSTYTHKNYILGEKLQKNDYRNYKPIITKGTFRREGKFYFFKPNNQDFEVGRYKITDDKIIYYYDWKENKIRKGGKFKRIKKNSEIDRL